MLLALAYILEEDVKEIFKLLANEAPEELNSILKYYNKYYVDGRIDRGQRKAIVS